MQSTNESGVMRGLAHIGVFTPDVEMSLRFYTDILGFEQTYQKDIVRPGGTTRLGFVQMDSLIIELIQPADTSGLKEKSAGLVDHIAIEVTGIDELITRLRENNIAFESEKASDLPVLFQGVKNIFFSGPSGERLELFEFLK